MNDDAKIIGITPDAFTRIGINVVCPPYILLPLTCFAYCTVILLSPPSIKTMNAKSATTRIKNPKMFQSLLGSVGTVLNAFRSEVPAVERIPTKMISDVPLPMPYSVILSPSHMTITLPPTRITIT